MSTGSVMQRIFAPPPRNVGGGDMVTRMLAILALLLLAGMIAPQAKIPYPLLKISMLVAAELGLVSLMLGLFLRSKTYFAGVQLFAASLLMLWLTGQQFPYLGILVAVLFIGIGLISVVTRSSRLNAVLELSSLRVPLEEVEAAAAAEPVDDSKNPQHPAPKTHAEGAR